MRALLVVLLGLAVSGELPTTTSASDATSANYVYDGPTIARLDVHLIDGADTRPTQPTGVREASAPPSVDGRGTSTTLDTARNATEAAGGVDTGMVHGPPLGRPNFVANANGETVAVPEGAVGPTMAETGKGIQFTGGSGGRGQDPRVTDVRIMDPVTSGKYQYPDGYVVYSNGSQTVNPWTGQTVSNADPWAHWPWSPR